MRQFSKVLASSVFFGSSTPAFSSSGSLGPTGTASSGQSFSISNFGSQGSQGGPTLIPYGSGVALQGLFGGEGNLAAASGGMGTLNLLGSNTIEPTQFSIIATSVVGSTGSVMLRDSSPWYQYVDFRFIPNSLRSTTAFLTVRLSVKGTN